MAESTSTLALSVVIPAYNEEARLHHSLAQVCDYLATRDLAAEVIVVDDGSTDATAAVVESAMRQWPALRLISGPHAGKGGAVRAGVLQARGSLVALADADLSMPVETFDDLRAALTSCDIAIGSREAPGAERFDEPVYRHLMGRAFNRLVQLLLLPGINDTQCGFKLLRRTVAQDLCARQTVTGWGFDAELLYLARRGGYRIREVPIPWHYRSGSRISPLRDTLTMLRDVLAIRANSLRGRYGTSATPRPTEAVEAAIEPLPLREQ